MRTGRTDLAEKALNVITERLKVDNWPEYYDGRKGSLIGRRANFYQTWSATGLIVAHQVYEDPEFRALFDSCMYTGSITMACAIIP